jgi:hypothetical protein
MTEKEITATVLDDVRAQQKEDADRRQHVAIRQTTAPAQTDETSAFLQTIERMAVNPDVDIEKLKALMAMRKEFLAEKQRVAFDAAFAEMQPELPTIDRNGRIVVFSKADRDAGKTDGKPIQNTPYALFEDISEAVRPVLANHGFGLSFRTGEGQGGKLRITGILSHRDGHRETDFIDLQHDSTGSKNAVQAVGSSVSYGKRYVTINLLNVVSRASQERDDDGRTGGAPIRISDEQHARLIDKISETGANEELFLEFLKVDNLSDLPADKYDFAIERLETRAKRKGTA